MNHVEHHKVLRSVLLEEMNRDNLTEEHILWKAYYDPTDTENPPPEFKFMGEHIPFQTPTLYAWTGSLMFRVDGDVSGELMCRKRVSYDDYPVIFIDYETYNPFAGVRHNMTFDVPIKEAV